MVTTRIVGLTVVLGTRYCRNTPEWRLSLNVDTAEARGIKNIVHHDHTRSDTSSLSWRIRCDSKWNRVQNRQLTGVRTAQRRRYYIVGYERWIV